MRLGDLWKDIAGKAQLLTSKERAALSQRMGDIRNAVVPQSAQDQYALMRANPLAYLQQINQPRFHPDLIPNLAGAGPISLFRGGFPYDPTKVRTGLQGAMSTTTNKDVARFFALRGGVIEEFELLPKAKVLREIPEKIAKASPGQYDEFEQIVKYARENGYDAIDLRQIDPDMGEFRILNPDVIKPLGAVNLGPFGK